VCRGADGFVKRGRRTEVAEPASNRNGDRLEPVAHYLYAQAKRSLDHPGPLEDNAIKYRPGPRHEEGAIALKIGEQRRELAPDSTLKVASLIAVAVVAMPQRSGLFAPTARFLSFVASCWRRTSSSIGGADRIAR
jgi:hypothetical protein